MNIQETAPHFGVAGFPPNFFESDLRKKRENIFLWLNQLGLDWIELQCTRGVKIRVDQAMNEINTGAFQSISHAMKGYSKTAKEYMNNAKIQIRDGKEKEAKESLDRAIKVLKEARKEAEQIDDDGFLEHIAIQMIMNLVAPIGTIAYMVGHYYSWYTVRKQSDKGDAYSNKHPERKKNLVLEFFLGKLRSAGYSRSMILAGYDKLIGECEIIKKSI